MLDMFHDRSDRVRPVTFPAGSGTLAGTLFLTNAAPRAAVVLNGATAVPAGFYAAFARWLADTQDIACLTYDYRDMGRSAQVSAGQSRADMLTWALEDQPAARAEMRRLLPGVPLWVIGHSLGAMLLPMQDGICDIERVIAVGSGFVNLRDHPWPMRAAASTLWYGAGPALISALGYVPGRWVGLGQDLPAGAFRDWRAWCTDPRFCFMEIGDRMPRPDWRRSRAPVKLVAMSDDAMMPPHCVRRLAQIYGARRAEHVLLDPAAFGLRRLGHIAPFARRNSAVWPTLIS